MTGKIGQLSRHVCYIAKLTRAGHFDPLQRLDTKFEAVHGLRSEVPCSLHLKQEYRCCDVNCIRLRRNNMAVTGGPREKAKKYKDSVGSFETLPEVMPALRIASLFVLAVSGEQGSMQEYPCSMI